MESISGFSIWSASSSSSTVCVLPGIHRRDIPSTSSSFRPAKRRALEVFKEVVCTSGQEESDDDWMEELNANVESDDDGVERDVRRISEPGRSLKPTRKRSSVMSVKVDINHPAVHGTVPYLSLHSKTSGTHLKHVLNLRRIVALVLGEEDKDTTHTSFFRALIVYDFQSLLHSLNDPAELGGKSNRKNMLSTLSKVLRAMKLTSGDMDDCTNVLSQIAVREEWIRITIAKITAEKSDSDSEEVTLSNVPTYEVGMEAVKKGQRQLAELSNSPTRSSRQSYGTVLNVVAGSLQWGIQCTRWMLFNTVSFEKLSALIGDGSKQFLFDSRDFKTRKTFKRQAVVITQAVCKTLHMYMTVFRKPAANDIGTVEPFFTNFEGRPLTSSDWNRKLQNFNAIFLNSDCRITSTILRAAMDTRATRCARNEDVDIAALRRSDTHSSRTAEKYYNKVTVREIAKNGAKEFAKVNKSISYQFSDSD